MLEEVRGCRCRYKWGRSEVERGEGVSLSM